MTLYNPEVNYCYISSDVYYSCLHHALSTEIEEVMGLLIGWKDDVKNACYITNSLPLKRLDKRKDRVEISPEVLSDSITVCDNLNSEITKAHEKAKSFPARYRNEFSSPLAINFSSSSSINVAEPKNLCAVGWYHSHPHITVYPSEVDLRTQDSFQSMVDKMWLGLIFGVYNNEEPTKTNHLQLIAFQSVMHNGRMVQSLIPVIVDPHLSPVNHSMCNNNPDSINGDFLMGVSLDVRTKKLLDQLHRPLIPNKKTLENLRDSFLLLVDEEKLEYEKAQQEVNVEKNADLRSSHLWHCQLLHVYAKNIWKIISMLAEPMYEVLTQIENLAGKSSIHEGNIAEKRL